ncbi:cystatin-B-like [Gouania willdenowi]|nr:cystatin-B-like [Gouania willdenowi]
MSMCGGLTAAKPADQSIQDMCDQVKGQAEQKAGKSFPVFEAKSYCSQVVAGTNHFIKIHVGDSDHIHLRVFKSLPHAGSELKVHGVQQGKKLEDPIEHF